uniref:Uncharacterized protein n=1 Tax=Myoviridae sp. cte0t5 TaxID=2823549 RepID=A0A8S5LHE9_9CAUD|nr:MAG TPA: hypothetical protein [Myoviridae sp. cte0t5]
MMAGPTTRDDAPPGGRGGQYVTVPAFAALGHSTPANSRTAPGSTIVYSPKGWRWEEAGDDYSKAVSKLTAATMESAVRRIKSSMGEVYYIRGTADTRPPFDGTAVGDTCRVQDAQTLDIVAEWRWDGSSWERMRVTSEQISNLDVGKLTAGSANIAEVTARKIASDVGRFLEITTDQLTVTGNASFVNATAHHVWTEIVTAGQGEFEKITAGMLEANSVSASNIQAGALDGKVITGATIQTERASNRGLKLSSAGLQVYSAKGWKSLDIDARTGEITINGSLGRQDSWSKVWFNDIVWAQTGTDISRSGAKIGCGLAFNSLEDDWEDGALFIQKDANTGEPSITLQSAARKGAEARPSLILGTQQVSITVGPNGNWGSLAISKYGFSSKINAASFTFNDSGISYRKTNDNNFAYLGLGRDFLSFATLGNKNTGMWATANGLEVAWRLNPHIYLDNSGIQMTGNKKFIMPVPRLTKERGMWLSHSCTESPYDGIEYWENLTLDEGGHASWALPDYVPRIASPKAPWVVFASGTASAALDRSNPGEWVVRISGDPGAAVDVLVKGARMVDFGDVDAAGEPVLQDHSRMSRWSLPPDLNGGGAPGEGDSASENDMTLPGTYYGPATKPADWSNTDGTSDQPG